MTADNINNIAKQIRYRIFVSLIIVAICVLLILYIIGLIEIPLFENIIFKLVITALGCISFFTYTYFYFKKHARTFYIIIFAAIFEIFGYWWLDYWIGYIFIVFGFILLVLDFFILRYMNDKPTNI